MSVCVKRRARPAFYVIASLVLLVGVFWAWQSNRTRPLPDDSQLAGQVKILISNGWSWLAIDNVTVAEKFKESNGWLVKFAYTLTVMRDESALPPTEIERFRRFLPMCDGVNVQTGGSCAVEETLLFIFTDDYGWVPELAVKYRPEILPYITGKLR